MKNKLAARIVAVLLASAALATHAADLLDDVKTRGTLRIGMEGTYPPFNYKNDKGELDGFDVDIAKALAAKLGVKPEFTTTEWSGILAGLHQAAGSSATVPPVSSRHGGHRRIFNARRRHEIRMTKFGSRPTLRVSDRPAGLHDVTVGSDRQH